MTVSSQTRGITFVGTGLAAPFPLPFRFFNNSEITAYLVEDNGALTLLTQGTDYTLTGAGEPEIDGGAIGVLTKTTPLTSGKKMYVARTLPAVQQTDIVNQGDFFASVHEDVFDRLTMVDQQHAEELSRCIKTSPTDEITPDQLLASIKTSENNAAASAASAGSSATSAAASFDSFDDRYLGSKAADPAADNDGDPLIVGALYWNTPLAKMKAWDGSAWTFWSGDISGPATSTDSAIAVFDGTNGKTVKSTLAKVNSAGEVIANGAQIGQSATNSNNFHWRNLLDGLLRLTRGNAGTPITDVMRVKADNSVEFPGGISGGFAKEYVSAEQTITLGAVTSLTHGLGAKPKLVTLSLIFKTADLGYAVDDEIDVRLDANNNSAGASVGRNATTLRLIVGASGMYAHNASGAVAFITPANCRLIVRAWL
jgi:hypothetical protein